MKSENPGAHQNKRRFPRANTLHIRYLARRRNAALIFSPYRQITRDEVDNAIIRGSRRFIARPAIKERPAKYDVIPAHRPVKLLARVVPSAAVRKLRNYDKRPSLNGRALSLSLVPGETFVVRNNNGRLSCAGLFRDHTVHDSN